MEIGDRYVVSSSDTLYRIPNSSCSEGDSIDLSNTQVVTYRKIGNQWYASNNTTISSYYSNSYICHVYNSPFDFIDRTAYVLPAVVIVVCLFSCIYHWFLRLRG